MPELAGPRGPLGPWARHVSHLSGPALSLEPDGLDLGAVKACETLQRQADRQEDVW